MLEYSLVAQQFEVLSGLEEPEAQKWTYLCTAAADELDRIVAPGVDRCLWHDRLILAAAALAYYRYALVMGCEGTQQIKIGDLALGGAEQLLATAKRLKEELWSSLSPILKGKDTVLIQAG